MSKGQDFNTWLDTFLDEKDIGYEHLIEVEGPSGLNIIQVGQLVEAMKSTTQSEKEGIKTMLVKIDFYNGSVMSYLEHLAKAVAI